MPLTVDDARSVTSALDALVAERGEPKTWEDAFIYVSTALEAVMTNRHRKYGPGNITRHGLAGVIVRADDKLARLDNLVMQQRGASSADESVEDTLGDFSNYGAIGIMLTRDWWTLPADCLGQVTDTE